MCVCTTNDLVFIPEDTLNTHQLSPLLLRLLVHFDDEMVGRFLDEDDFIIDMQFDNQKGCFDLYVFY